MIGILIFPEFQLLDVAGPISVLEVARRHGARIPELRVLAVAAGPVKSSSGVPLVAAELGSVDALTTLIVSGGEGVESAASCATTLAFVRRISDQGSRVASVCNGAFLLAQAGLLDGRRATTHWSLTKDFIARYPRVKIEPDQIYTRDGRFWTSAGISAGIDLALAMVAEDHGEAIVQSTARHLVLYHRRGGGQSQFSSLLELKAPSGRFATLLSWVREHLSSRLTVEDLADRAGMSARHFARAFVAETGMTPSKAIEKLRLEVARERVQFSSESIDRVAQSAGFRDPERMRRAFIRAFGQPPQSLRRVARGV
jgi:transcriptional regulator GlxA family with amidase domain